jgi:hypothetical protein
MTSHPLQPADIYGSDPLARLFLNTLRLKPWMVALSFVFAGALYGFILPIYQNIPPARDWITIINIALVFPMAGYYYAYQPNSILRVYHSVTRFLKEESNGAVSFETLRARHAKRLWWLAGIFIGAVSAGFRVASGVKNFGTTWENLTWGQSLLVYGVRFLAMSMIGVIVARHIAVSISLNNLFERAQFPLTLDTDRIEVFSAVKRFSLEIIGVAAIVGLNLGLQPLVIEVPMPEYAFYVVMYFILVPVTFFLPLWQVHRRMVAIKAQMLEKLHKDFQEESDKLYETLAKDPKKDLSASYLKQSEGLIAIKQAIELINRSPEWPFEGTVIYRLVITLLSPFFLVLFEIFINIISNLVMPG